MTGPKRWTPTVSVVVPVLNEARYIDGCLRSVQAQDYPAELVEIIVADGGSTDETPEIVARHSAADRRIRLIENPRRNQAAGLNEAIAASSGEVVARLDGHAEWGPGHLSRCIAILAETGADNVGGTMEAIGENATGQAIARATSSPFGVGGARYRYATQQTTTDTVWLGCFRRETLDRVGPYNERYPPHEDYELNYRIVAAGGRIVFSPDLPTLYWVRSSWRTLLRQYFLYGRAKARVARASPGVLRPYHLVAPLAVAAAAAGALLSTTRRAMAPTALLYAAACCAASIPAGRGSGLRVRWRIPLVFAIMHAGWGTGFWAGILEPILPVASTGK
jgi:GT2 family glycosyltransferase